MNRLRVDLSQLVHDAVQWGSAINFDHGRKLWFGDPLYIPGDVAQREGVYRAGVLERHEGIHRLEAPLTNSAGGHHRFSAVPAVGSQDYAVF